MICFTLRFLYRGNKSYRIIYFRRQEIYLFRDLKLFRGDFISFFLAIFEAFVIAL